MEIEELTKRGLITELTANNPRQALFWLMKYPNDILYKGKWGPEILHFTREADVYQGKTGRVYCSYQRYTEIAKWLLDNLFAA